MKALLAPNTAVLSVIGIETVFIRTTVIERDYGMIHPGQTALISVDAFPGKHFSGTVSRIAPKLQENSRVAEMEVTVKNDSLVLKPGMFARVTVVLREKDDAQLVSSRAVIMQSGKPGVYVVRGDETIAHYVPVQTGIVSAEKTEIIEPLLEGKVITLGQHLLEDGSPVILPQTAGVK